MEPEMGRFRESGEELELLLVLEQEEESEDEQRGRGNGLVGVPFLSVVNSRG